jgi:hypothetical protein
VLGIKGYREGEIFSGEVATFRDSNQSGGPYSATINWMGDGGLAEPAKEEKVTLINKSKIMLNVPFSSSFSSSPVAPLLDLPLSGDSGNFGNGVFGSHTDALETAPYNNSNTNTYVLNNPNTRFTLPSTFTNYDNWWIPFALNYYDRNGTPINFDSTAGKYFGFATGYVSTLTAAGNHMATANAPHTSQIGDSPIHRKSEQHLCYSDWQYVCFGRQ